MNERKFIAIINYDEDTALEYAEANGIEYDSPGHFLEREFGWIEPSGFSLDQWMIYDSAEDCRWHKYINSLILWAFDHLSYDCLESAEPPIFDQSITREASINEIRIRNISASICDVFEELLDRVGISLPSEDRAGDECEAHIFGDTYSQIEDEVTRRIERLYELIKHNPKIQINSDRY